MSKGAILILLRPEMKSTFHHTLIALAIVDILFLVTLIIDSQVAARNSYFDLLRKMNFTKLPSQNLDLDLKNQTFIFLFPYVWNPFKNILMTFETFLMMSITTERYLATRSPLEYRMGRVILYPVHINSIRREQKRNIFIVHIHLTHHVYMGSNLWVPLWLLMISTQ